MFGLGLNGCGWSEILLMEEILHQLIWQISHDLQGFITIRGFLTGFLPSTVAPWFHCSGLYA